MLEEVYAEAKDRMQKSLDAVSRELGTIRTGKASPHLLDSVKVDAYGSVMPLNQVATISAPEPRLLVVQAFDKNTIGDIIKGIQKADIGLNPSIDGSILRLSIPQLNEERRLELAKQCKHLAEEGRVAIRNIRRDLNDTIKAAQKASTISEDQSADGHDEIQKQTNDFIKKIDDLLAKKEVEIMEV